MFENLAAQFARSIYSQQLFRAERVKDVDSALAAYLEAISGRRLAQLLAPTLDISRLSVLAWRRRGRTDLLALRVLLTARGRGREVLVRLPGVEDPRRMLVSWVTVGTEVVPLAYDHTGNVGIPEAIHDRGVWRPYRRPQAYRGGSMPTVGRLLAETRATGRPQRQDTLLLVTAVVGLLRVKTCRCCGDRDLRRDVVARGLAKHVSELRGVKHRTLISMLALEGVLRKAHDDGSVTVTRAKDGELTRDAWITVDGDFSELLPRG
jgi:hypothetical protein